MDRIKRRIRFYGYNKKKNTVIWIEQREQYGSMNRIKKEYCSMDRI